MCRGRAGQGRALQVKQREKIRRILLWKRFAEFHGYDSLGQFCYFLKVDPLKSDPPPLPKAPRKG